MAGGFDDSAGEGFIARLEGDTVVELTNGSKWKQAEYHYEYHYACRPEVMLPNG